MGEHGIERNPYRAEVAERQEALWFLEAPWVAPYTALKQPKLGNRQDADPR